MNAEMDISKISGDQQEDWPLGKNPGYRNGVFKYLRPRAWTETKQPWSSFSWTFHLTKKEYLPVSFSDFFCYKFCLSMVTFGHKQEYIYTSKKTGK